MNLKAMHLHIKTQFKAKFKQFLSIINLENFPRKYLNRTKIRYGKRISGIFYFQENV